MIKPLSSVARFPDHFVQQVAQATDIVELVGQYLALKKRGREFVGLCPFHDDQRPSLNVSPAKQIFKCFACGAGGGVFNFLMLLERSSFPEAVRALAQRANIPMPRDLDDQAGQADHRATLAGAMSFAAQFYQQQLWSPAGQGALDYARGRGLSDESIRRFGLGFSPDAWDALLTAGRRAGLSVERMLQAGLIAPRPADPGHYDRFRNRLMFPIIDTTGKTIAFGGRALAQDERAKYLNSPDTPLFDKSQQLYGLNWARESIAAGDQAVVVEGYLDVLIPHQAGLTNVVATLGTSLTDQHVRLLRRYAREVVLLFDSDTAGAAAAERAMELFVAQQLHVRVAAAPRGKDPCDYCLAAGGEALRALVAGAPDALQYVWERRLEAYRAAGGNLADRAALVDDFLRLAATSGAYGAIDQVRRSQLAQHIGHMLNISPLELQQQMQRHARKVTRSSGAPAGRAEALGAAAGLGDPRRQVLEVVLLRPEMFDQVAERLGMEDFDDPVLRQVAEGVWRHGLHGRLGLEELLADEELVSQGALLADMVDQAQRRGNHEKTLSDAVEALLHRRRQRELTQLKSGGLDDEAIRQRQQQATQPDLTRWTGIH
jgi:DNA primase